MLRMGVIGYGYWGPNIARNFAGADGVHLAAISDRNPDALKRAQKAFPAVELTSDHRDLTTSSAIDAVAVVTPVSLHYHLAREALQNGKHIFVEKPFTATTAEAEELIELAAQKNLTIMVDHTFLFTGAVRKMKELIDQGELGNLCYYDSMRVNLGLFQHDVNVIWDLAPHDLAIMDHLIPVRPEAILATGGNHYTPHEYVAYLTIHYANNIIGHLNVNWLSPVKVRTTLLGGEKKMLVWNDLDPDMKIKVYDKGVEIRNKEGVYDLLVSYRSGDMWAPKLDQTEALKLEAEYFVDCVENGKTPFNDGVAGMRIVHMLEGAGKSLKHRGEIVYL